MTFATSIGTEVALVLIIGSAAWIISRKVTLFEGRVANLEGQFRDHKEQDTKVIGKMDEDICRLTENLTKRDAALYNKIDDLARHLSNLDGKVQMLAKIEMPGRTE